MRVPLAVVPIDDKLKVFRNRTSEEMEFPFKPFILVESSKFNDVEAEEEIWNKVPEHELRSYKRLNFQTIKEQNEFKLKNIDRSQYMFMNGYIEQMFISHPDLMLNYPHEEPLRIMYYDIEVASKGDGIFPKAISHEVLCIGYSIWEYSAEGGRKKLRQGILKGFTSEAKDKYILQQFGQTVQECDPEIISGYNTDLFDWPFIIQRCQLMGVNLKLFGKDNKEVKIVNGHVRIPGRINFDIYNSNAGVHKDQTLFGMKSRTLKIMARHYKANIDDIELQEDIENLLALFNRNPEKLYKYQEADVLRTEHVGNVYVRNCITLAELMHIPLDNVMNMYSSLIPKLMIARAMENKRLINTVSNFQKYNKENGSLFRLGNKYEGALVGLYKDGLFPKVYKLDFTSMYPSSIQTWNLGPDTTVLVATRPYTGKYRFNRDSRYMWFNIPDENFKQDLLIKVDHTSPGLLKSEITRLRKERVKIKDEMKSCEPEKYDALQSQQWAIKVLLNSIYGILGLKSSTYGDMIGALMVTAMCRWTTGTVIRRFKDNLIELDTDGIIVDRSIDEDEVNKWLDNLMLSRFKIDDNYMQMELEEFGRAFFIAMKNYIIEDNGKYEIHGSALKSSRLSRVIDRATDLCIKAVFNAISDEEAVTQALDFNKVPLEDFEERIKLSKEPREYDDQHDQRLFIAKQMEMKTGLVPTKGLQLNYLVTKEPLPFKELKPYLKAGSKWNYTFSDYVKSVDELDLVYYRERINKIFDKFGIDPTFQMELDLGFTSRHIKRSRPLDKVPEDEL